jgi:hypothetical protein
MIDVVFKNYDDENNDGVMCLIFNFPSFCNKPYRCLNSTADEVNEIFDNLDIN